MCDHYRKCKDCTTRTRKTLHTDDAKEQDTAKLREFLTSNETKTTDTAPNASQSNYFAERRFRQLKAATGTTMAETPHMPKTFWSYAVLDAAEKGNCLAQKSKVNLNRAHTLVSRSNFRKLRYQARKHYCHDERKLKLFVR